MHRHDREPSESLVRSSSSWGVLSARPRVLGGEKTVVAVDNDNDDDDDGGEDDDDDDDADADADDMNAFDSGRRISECV
eukprot:2169086-Rhodomonas_salina.3